MPNHVCAVADCKSDARRHSMHAVQGTIKGWARFPPPIKEPKRRKLWEDRCRRPAGWRSTRNHCICSLHFINWGENKPSQKHPDPELFAYNGWGKNCPKVLKRNKNVLQVQAQPHEVPDEPQDFSNGSSTSTQTQRSGDSSHTEEVYVFRGVQDWSEVEIGLNDTTKNVTEQCSSLSTSTVVGETYHSASDHTYASFTDSGGATVDPSDVGVQTDDFEIPTPEVAAAVDADIKGTLRQAFINRILRSDMSVKKFTGMLSREYLDNVFKMIDKSVTDIYYWRGQKAVKENNPTSHKNSKGRELSRFQEFLMTLVFLREGYDYNVLGEFFEISSSLVSSIIITWINILQEIFKDWIVYPSAAQVRASLPSDYPVQYADTRVILDCTEFFTVRPGNLTAQAATYSTYKHHNTLKVLIGITPTGLISFVSNVYGGNTSDRFIAEAEFTDKVEAGDAIMVDRGFTIGDLILQRGGKLYMPPFTRKSKGNGKKLNQHEILKTRNIASLRIHVERAIQRMKTYKILRKTIDAELWPVMDYIVKIVAVFCNMLPPICTN